MSDIPFFSDKDPVITWASVKPTVKPLAKLRGEMGDAWERYFLACDAYQAGECKFEHIEATRQLAEAAEARYKAAYARLQEIEARQLAKQGECACFLPEQTCPVCAAHGDPEAEYPY